MDKVRPESEPPISYVGTPNSVPENAEDAIPKVSNTRTVQEMASDRRTVAYDPPTAPAHDRTEFAVAVPKTANENGLPPPMSAFEELNFSVIKREVTASVGAARLKVKVDVGPIGDKLGVPLAPVVYVGVVKSAAKAVVVADADFAVTVHEIASPTWTYVVCPLTCPTH